MEYQKVQGWLSNDLQSQKAQTLGIDRIWQIRLWDIFQINCSLIVLAGPLHEP